MIHVVFIIPLFQSQDPFCLSPIDNPRNVKNNVESYDNKRAGS